MFAACEAMLAFSLKFFINALEGKPSEAIYFIPASVTSAIYFIPLAVIVLSLFRGLGAYLGNFFMGKLGLSVVNGLRKRTFSHMVHMPQSHYDAKNSGELVSLIIYNIEQVTGSVTNALKILFRDGFSVLAFLFTLLYINWKLTLVFFTITPILGGLVYFAGKYFRKTSRRIQSAVGKVTHICTETFQGIQLVKSYGGEEYEKKRFGEAADNNLQYATKFERVAALQTPILHNVIAVALAVILFLVIKIWDGPIAEAVVYVTVTGLITKPFRQLSSVNAIIQKGAAASETIFSILDSPQEVNTGTRQLSDVKGKIEFQDVSFSYSSDESDAEKNADKPALDSVNLVINPGETVALVGKSGSGKTTIVSLLQRFYSPSKGSILIDGNAIDDIETSSLRANIGLVNQQTILFNDTIKANISYGRDAQDTSLDAVVQAAENAYAKSFIEEMDDGFETVIGEDGARLSGGQRQRLAIARALLKNAPILILDEATSALDNESEKQIQAALEKLKHGRTTLVIAHRLSTIESADKIIVLNQGKVEEIGSHATLLQKNGAYTQLYNAQFSEDSSR